MALIKCKECGRQISDSADVCMGCGAPVSGGNSVENVGNVAFEKRIDEYKNAGYKLSKREDFAVTMFKTNPVKLSLLIIFTIVFLIVSALTEGIFSKFAMFFVALCLSYTYFNIFFLCKNHN